MIWIILIILLSKSIYLIKSCDCWVVISPTISQRIFPKFFLFLFSVIRLVLIFRTVHDIIVPFVFESKGIQVYAFFFNGRPFLAHTYLQKLKKKNVLTFINLPICKYKKLLGYIPKLSNIIGHYSTFLWFLSYNTTMLNSRLLPTHLVFFNALLSQTGCKNKTF